MGKVCVFMANPLLEQAEKIYRHARQGSIHTRREYRKCFLRFIDWLWTNYQVKKLRNISNKHLRAYIQFLLDQGCGPAYIVKSLAAIRYYHDQVPEPRYQLEKSNQALGAPKREWPDNRGWCFDEYKQLKDKAREKRLEWLMFLLALMWVLGLRIHEGVGLYRRDLDRALDSGFLVVKGKGGKVRGIELDPIAYSIIQKLRNKTPRGARVFVPKGEKAHRVIYKVQSFIRENRPYREGEPLTAHGLRYSYAQRRYYKIKGEGLPTKVAEKKVSEELGHNRPQVTRGYLSK